MMNKKLIKTVLLGVSLLVMSSGASFANEGNGSSGSMSGQEPAYIYDVGDRALLIAPDSPDRPVSHQCKIEKLMRVYFKDNES
ncbi:hypothetical protein EDC18_103105 [Natranaerovirga pectinivora]|uniref:Uncharacterized protein n=1 Tax=Natranaerovirga pectinivora TaxID=682400 RepID=A0A4V6NZU0_9FIRM|nr:hypothetical protein [Natranaerovirga pectinivora]TCT15400.1 hypothetical protein EDC18_103105 [Natranaerovirga pectinivora]